MLGCGYERGSEVLESSFFEKVKKEIKVQPMRTKKEENKEAKKERIKEVSGAAKKSREIIWVGHVYAKGKMG